MEKRLLKPSEFAQAISAGRATVYRMISEQRIRTVVVNSRLRIPASELDRIAEEGAPSRIAG